MPLMDGGDAPRTDDGSVLGGVVAGLARRLALGDGWLARARDLRRGTRALGPSLPPDLRRAALVSALLPPLGVALARRALGVACGPAPVACAPVASGGRGDSLVITTSADPRLAAACAAALPAAKVFFVGRVRPDRELSAALGDRAIVSCGSVTDAAILCDGPRCPRVSFHGLDGGELEEAAREFNRPERLDLNIPPSDDPVPPPGPVDCDWTEAGLRRAVRATETPEPLAAPGAFARHMRTFSYGYGRCYLRLEAGAEPEACLRALDCLVAMRHVWIVSVDRSHDPHLIERVARDAAFCEVQSRGEFLEYVQAADRVRLLGPRPDETPFDAALVVGPLSSRPEEEIRHHYVRQLLRVGLPSVIDPLRLARGCTESGEG
ncbi:MAG: hypothetical protein ACKORI_09780 [Verrucomicrobiota bacterium]